MTPKILGSRIRKEREKKGYTQRELAMRVGLSDKSISLYEKGVSYPPIRNLLVICKELDITIGEILST
ncbi:TPA: helix-turn-helix transcriptional regulator [Candidatus Dojkabacteria bacterium]|jgi:transcriptional regulator with XRE-family HTH domain|uniref:Helix-turn-helix transcriptional regulator n=1 Tax=Candidatus Dojkabacteria bacterium TaxID=2099670 RepID=A0A832R8Y5_9BACT|nr:helix-turn-helix transcriptional regulator [Candidatus Dojkabacteria bacterium]